MKEGTGRIRVLLADAHDLERSGIKALLARIADFEVVAEASTGEGLLAALRWNTPDVVITDLSMPTMDGVAAIEAVRALDPRLPILVLSMHDTADYVKRATAAGSMPRFLR